MWPRFKIIVALIVLSFFFILTPPCVLADVTVSVKTPASAPIVGDLFNVFVEVDSVIDLFAFQFDLNFDPAVLFANSTSEGAFLRSDGDATFFIPGTIDNSSGSITFTSDTLIGAILGISGSGVLANINFHALAEGSSEVSLSNVVLLDSNIMDIQSETLDGTVWTKSGTAVPEPGILIFLSSGLIWLGFKKRSI